jgi:shikimate kinase
MDFLDLDEYIEEREGQSIPELYSQLGDEGFRLLERKALKESVISNHIVISTGGGAPCHCENMNLMEKYGEVIYLKVSDETLIMRLMEAARHRPIVMGKNEEEIREYVSEVRKKCEHNYHRAKYTVDGENTDLEKVISMLGS